MLDLGRLRALHAVSTHGSVQDAAAALHVTTSAVSQQLGKLEREVGQRLIERNGRGVRLTDAALLLAGHAGRILTQVEEARSDLEAARGAVRGHVTVAAFASGARGLMPGVLCDLRDRYPDLAVELRELEMEDTIPMIERGDIDVAIVNDWDTEPLAPIDGIVKTPLVDDVFDLVLAAGHRLAGSEAVNLAELDGERWIGWTKDSICNRWLMRTLRNLGIEPWIAHTVEDHLTQMTLVAAGLGTALLPRIGRPAKPADVRIVALRPSLARHIYAINRAGAAHRPAVRAVIGALRAAGVAGSDSAQAAHA